MTTKHDLLMWYYGGGGSGVGLVQLNSRHRSVLLSPLVSQSSAGLPLRLGCVRSLIHTYLARVIAAFACVLEIVCGFDGFSNCLP